MIRACSEKLDVIVLFVNDKLRFDLLGVTVGKLRIDWSPNKTFELGPLRLKYLDEVEALPVVREGYCWVEDATASTDEFP